jgi:hypothetical protein
MQTRDNDKKQPEEEKRDLELENIVGIATVLSTLESFSI